VQPEPIAARFVVVGCGTVVPEADRGSSAYWLESGRLKVLLDCGPGALRAMARLGLPWHSITDLVLTHFHADHTGAIPGLMFSLTWGLLPSRRQAPLTVHGPPGTVHVFEALAAAFGPFMLEPGFEVRIQESEAGGTSRLAPGIDLTTCGTPHTDESRAVRIDLAGAKIGYTGDTGPSDALPPFFRDCDLLVSECSLPDSHAIATHLSPESVASMACESNPGCLLLTHVYPQFRAAADVPALVRQAGWTGPIQLAEEGWERSFSL
jgi:ribonuclease BN (tRNA processing enzyme)